MSTRPLFLAAAAASTLILTGCASIIDGGHQTLTFASVPSQANITITSSAGVLVHSGFTPASVSLKRGKGYFKSESYTVAISKPGFTPQTIVLEGHVNGWYFANILFGGVIGMLIVDPLTGAMYTLDPDQVTATLRANRLGFRDGERGLVVLLAEQVPTGILEKAHKLPVGTTPAE